MGAKKQIIDQLAPGDAQAAGRGAQMLNMLRQDGDHFGPGLVQSLDEIGLVRARSAAFSWAIRTSSSNVISIRSAFGGFDAAGKEFCTPAGGVAEPAPSCAEGAAGR